MKIEGKPSSVVPKLRFAEFTDEPPWECTSLKELAKRITKRNENGTDLRVLTNSAEHGVVDQREYFDKSLSTNRDSYYVVETGDYVYNPRKSSKAPVGPISKSRIGAGIMSPLYTVFRFHNDHNDFFAHYFRSSHWHSYIQRVSNSGARHDRLVINNKAFMQMPIPTPSPSEQIKISDCLDTLDDLVKAEVRKLDALQLHKLGLIQRLLPQLPNTQPKLRFPEFRDAPDWNTVRCRDIARVLPGYGFPDELQGNNKGQFPFYKVSDISRAIEEGNKYISQARNYIEPDVLKQIRGKPVPAGTIVFAKIGEAIRSNRRVITTEPAIIDNNTAGLKAIQKKCSDEFLFYLWSNISLIDYAGGVVPAVSKSTLEDIPLCYPHDPEEQQRIANCLDSLDKLIAAQLQKLIALRQHNQGLLQRLFPSLESQ